MSYNKLQQATTSYNKLQQATTSYNKQTSYVNGEKCLKSKDSVFDVSKIF